MYVKRYGNGERIVFGVHGWGGDHHTFGPLVSYLPGDVTLFSADLPAYGQSADPAAWDIEVIAEEVAAAVRKNAGDSCTLMGNCSGAIVGLLAAQKLQGSIGRLVLIDPFAYLPWYLRVFTAGEFGRRAYTATFASSFGRRLTNMALKSKRTADTDLTGSFARIDHEATLRYLVLLGEISSIERFGALNLPTDILYGERTFAAVRKSMVLWKGIWPHARTWELAGAGHLPIEEASSEVARIAFGPVPDTTMAVNHYVKG